MNLTKVLLQQPSEGSSSEQKFWSFFDEFQELSDPAYTAMQLPRSRPRSKKGSKDIDKLVHVTSVVQL